MVRQCFSKSVQLGFEYRYCIEGEIGRIFLFHVEGFYKYVFTLLRIVETPFTFTFFVKAMIPVLGPAPV